MNNLTPSQIRDIRNSLIPTFNNSAGGYYDKIDVISKIDSGLCRHELIYLMNPNFNSIYSRFHKQKDFLRYLTSYGICIYNEFDHGVPIDPITFSPIAIDDLVCIRDYGYSRDTSSRLINNDIPKNPMTNTSLPDNEIHNIEVKSALTDNEMLDVMNPN